MQDQVMIDIETLGTRANSVVLTMGAVVFDLNAAPGQFGEEFYAVLTTSEQEVLGRVKDQSTLDWWKKQDATARYAALERKDRELCGQALDRLFNILALGDYCVWGNGSDFDNAIVSDLFRTFEFETPWAFWNNRCFRTYKAMFKHLTGPVQFNGMKHHALDDAKHQAYHLQLIQQKLRAIGAVK